MAFHGYLCHLLFQHCSLYQLLDVGVLAAVVEAAPPAGILRCAIEESAQRLRREGRAEEAAFVEGRRSARCSIAFDGYQHLRGDVVED